GASACRRSCSRNRRPRTDDRGRTRFFHSPSLRTCRLSSVDPVWSATMSINLAYQSPGDRADVIPVFPLAGALLLPRGQMPLNIFEPRYLAMIDDALAERHRLIGMIQPDTAHPGPEDKPNLYTIGCVGRITQVAETGDGRYLIELTGVARFRIIDEPSVLTRYRQCRVDFHPFA